MDSAAEFGGFLCNKKTTVEMNNFSSVLNSVDMGVWDFDPIYHHVMTS
jgi:hypothetical protein